MATLIPDPIPTGSTRGEKDLARLLRKLPEDWTVYYEPCIRGKRPDFVILAPNHGVLILELKDWRIGTVRSIDPQWVERQTASAAMAKREKNPLRQADEYWRAMKDECQGSLYGRSLVRDYGAWRGNLCFPVGVAVVFTGISRTDVERSPHRAAWTSIFTSENTVLSDERRGWQDLDEAGLVAALKPYFRPFQMAQQFTAHQIDVLRWVLFPESRMDVILGREHVNAEEVKAVLDARQEQHARSLGSGHRILFGVAGSGKTVLLLARARWLAQERPGQTALLLCFNKVLAAWLQARLADCPSVVVHHFDGWARTLKIPRHQREDAESFGTRLLREVHRRGQAARQWDTVMIDEAQDFEPVWFQCALAAMKDPVDGDLVIVADGSQRLYKRNRVSWKSLGIKAAGRTISARYDLDKNYRNTPKIAALAAGYSDEERSEDGISGMRVSPAACRRLNASTPVFVETKNHGEQTEAAVEIVSRWLSGERNGRLTTPLNPSDIGIFYPRKQGRDGDLLVDLITRLRNLCPIRWLSDSSNPGAHKGVNDAALKVQSIHSAKGLQYKAVLVLWTDLLPQGAMAEDDERRLLYVAITRAESDLVLLGSGHRGFAGDLAKSCASRSYPFTTTQPVDAA